jgi:hypothetical protein
MRKIRLQYLFAIANIYVVGFLNRITNRGGNDLLHLIKDFRPVHNICNDWKTIKRNIGKLTNKFSYLKKNIPFPSEWRMDLWDQSIPPEELVIFVRDAVEIISYLLTDPILQFYYSNDILYDFIELRNNNNDRIIRDIMSTDWARLTEQHIRARDKNKILVPIILYTDGVKLGHLQNRQSIPVIGALGNCSVKLLRKDISKFIIGFIPYLDNISKESIVNHLITKCGLSKSKANDSIAVFNLQVQCSFWNEVKKPINNCYRNGCSVHILGKGIKCIHTCVPFTVGDIPAQQNMRHFYSSAKCNLPCIICNYSINSQQPYDDKGTTYKQINRIEEISLLAEQYFWKDIRNDPHDKLTVIEKNILQECRNKCIQPICSPFIHDLEMGINNDMNNYIVDILHVFCGGLMKSVLLWILTIINAVSLSEDIKFRKSKGLFDVRVSNFPLLPEIPHVNKCCFRKGLSFILESKSKKIKR